jgi:hypothetical protein
LERFYEQGDENDDFMQKDVEVEASEVEQEARRLLAEAEQRSDDTLAEKYRQLIADGEYQRVVQEWHGGSWDDAGNLYYLSNPDAKWDWYQIGGRWTGYFKLKPGAEGELGKQSLLGSPSEVGTADVAKVKDIDWDGMRAELRAQAEKSWDAYVTKLNSGEQFHPYFQFGVREGMAKDEFLAKQSSISTFAFLHDDEWIEHGSMGWWAIVTDEKPQAEWDEQFQNIINSLDPEDEVTVVDCHI